MSAAKSAAQAARRGARVVVRAAAEGPVAAAAGRDLIDPQVAVVEALAGPARLTVLVAVAAAAGLYPTPDFTTAADQLDALAVACHPSSEFFVNPALTLAEQLSVGTPLLIGTDPVADALAEHGCRSLAGLAGCAGAWLGSVQAAGSPPILARATGHAPGGAGGIFFDPYDEETPTGQQISTVLIVGPSPHSPAGPLTSSASALIPEPAFGSGPPGGLNPPSPLAAALAVALPRAMCIGQEEVPTTTTPDAESAPATGLAPRTAFAWTVAMLSRIDFAAVYLGLLTRARPPVDSPDGLGRPGRAAQHRPPTGGGPAWNERESGSWS
jgi:hypothetical protein